VDDDKYDIENRLRDIKKFKKIYDVCPVSIPAYDSTSISARSFFEAQEEEIKKIELEKRKRIMKLKLMC
jgi:phage head maturation protease